MLGADNRIKLSKVFIGQGDSFLEIKDNTNALESYEKAKKNYEKADEFFNNSMLEDGAKYNRNEKEEIVIKLEGIAKELKDRFDNQIKILLSEINKVIIDINNEKCLENSRLLETIGKIEKAIDLCKKTGTLFYSGDNRQEKYRKIIVALENYSMIMPKIKRNGETLDKANNIFHVNDPILTRAYLNGCNSQL